MNIDQLITVTHQPVKEPVDKRFVHLDGRSKPIKGWVWPWNQQSWYLVSIAHDRTHAHVARRESLLVTFPANASSGQAVELDLTYTAWCLPPRAEAFAIWYHHQLLEAERFRLDEALDDILRKAAASQFHSLPDDCTDMNGLQTILAQELKRACPELEFHVEPKTRPEAKKDWEALTPPPIELKFEDHPKPVVVQTKVLRLRLSNIRKHLIHRQHPDLEAWADWAVPDAGRSVVEKHSKSYTRFISEWTTLREEIKKEAVRLAGNIGYEVVALLNEPDTPEYSALREIQVNIVDRLFKPKDAGLSVKLSIHVLGRLHNLNQPVVQAAVGGNADIRVRLEENLINAVQTHLHEVTADDFYLGFDTVEPALLTVIKNVLDLFGVKGLGENDTAAKVSIKQGHSEITAVASQLYQQPIVIRDMEIPITASGEVARYDFAFVVDAFTSGDAAYARFARLAQAGSADVVRKTIEQALYRKLRAKIATLGVENVQYGDALIHKELEKGVHEMIEAFAAQEFGLAVHLESLYRHRSVGEIHAGDTSAAHREADLQTHQKSLEKLGEGNLAILEGHVEVAKDNTRSDEEREAARKKIEELAKKNAPTPASTGLPAAKAGIKIAKALLSHADKADIENNPTAQALNKNQPSPTEKSANP